jgi:hypothetical protein
VTPDELVELEQIKRLKYAYLRCIDQKDWDGLRPLLCDDATAAYSGGHYNCTGREEIISFVERNMGREQFHSSHRVHHPEITLDGDSASATWALEDMIVDTEWEFLLVGAAFYEDRYVRRDGRWQILHTGYRRSFELTMPMGSVEGIRLTASWWGTDGRSSLPAA